MKPPRFQYHVPESLDEALGLLAELGADAKPLAGGQSLVPLLNMRLARPGHLLDLNRVAELDYLTERDGGLALGAMTRQRAVERSALIRDRCPLLAQAIRYVGHLPIRTRGTIGGSVAHADPAAELPGVLAALDGRITLQSRSSTRVLDPADFFLGVLASAATPEELVTEIWLPAVPERTGQVWLEVARRHGDYALVGLGASVTLDGDGTISEARLALIGVGPVPVRARRAEERLRGEWPATSLFREAGRLVSAEIQPETDVHATSEYRRRVAAVLTERALAEATRQITRETVE
ncbi:xanthine dehydrogenase family protein subunit M [Thermomicrobiaceae bacterium CFH 74404]|uniref:Xanthine dehydrogenase family protein subunit M n=1 Tax=Thermalbibacter longus TaxID=2951981 RepID=A0AA41WDP1_9BACT|nr:xanthine dehydrogenase family protein subunit M [Thermalbibacter longus]MCM8750127.1 xanthine dehydrogenase family protein subunit M [Thermalbibacter longus]